MHTEAATMPMRVALLPRKGSWDTTVPATIPVRAPQGVTLELRLPISWPSSFRSRQKKPMHSRGAMPAPAME